MKVLVYRWGNEFVSNQLDTLIKKYNDVDIHTIEDENFYDVLEKARIHKLNFMEIPNNRYDIIFLIHSSLNLDNFTFPDYIEINNVYTIIEEVKQHPLTYTLPISNKFLYCDSITFNLITLLKKFKLLYNDLNVNKEIDLLYCLIVNNGIINNSV